LRFTTEAVNGAKSLTNFDPTEKGWEDYYGLYSQQLGGLQRQAGSVGAAATADADAVRVLSKLTAKDPTNSDWPPDLAQAQMETARLQLARNDIEDAGKTAATALAVVAKLRTKMPEDRGLILLGAQADILLGAVAARRRDTATAQRDWTQARNLLQPVLHAGDDPNFVAAYAEALLSLSQTKAAQPAIAELDAMGFRTPDFVALLTSKHIDYPVNAAFQQRLAQIMQSDIPEGRRPSNAPRPAGATH
jgi:hypothetical protein